MYPERPYNPNRSQQQPQQRLKFTPPPGTPTMPPNPVPVQRAKPQAVAQPQQQTVSQQHYTQRQPALPPQQPMMPQQAFQSTVSQQAVSDMYQRPRPARRDRPELEQTNTKPNKFWKRAGITILVLLILGGAGYGSWVYFDLDERFLEKDNQDITSTSQQSQQTETQPIQQEYTNAELGYKITLPEGWEKYRNPPQGFSDQFTSPKPQNGQVPRVINIISGAANGATLEKITETAKTTLGEQNQDFKLLDLRDASLDGVPAILLNTSSTSTGNLPTIGLQLIVVKDDRVYTVTALTAASEWETNKEILQFALLSFRFL